ALPDQVPHADAVHNAARAALLVAALGSGDADLLRDALDDRLHEPYRPLLPAVRERVAGDHAVLGATLSGAGPSVLVWCLPGSEQDVADRLAGLSGASARAVAVAEQGVSID